VSARVVIAADGRESRLARGVSLARHPERPRRWAVGAYFANVSGMTDRGEMHVRSGHYIGVAPLPGGLTNACVVTDDRARLREPSRLLAESLRNEPELADRFASADMVTRPVVLGPLAVECAAPGMPGMLLAGDAAGFIDPMTGDGLRFALRGAELAAVEALRALETADLLGHVRLAVARRREFAAKWRFNRTVRQLAGSADAVRLASYATRVSSWPISRIIRYAGDLSAA
jgi:flavin-dependent dehydrogenase